MRKSKDNRLCKNSIRTPLLVIWPESETQRHDYGFLPRPACDQQAYAAPLQIPHSTKTGPPS